jgi:hypothetical protein
MTQTAASPKPLSWTGAIAISLASILLTVLLVTYDRRLAPLAILTIFGTSVWAAIDSAKIELQKYKTWIALHPLVLFNAMYLFWFILFPWYLVVRSEIIAGVLPKRRVR